MTKFASFCDDQFSRKDSTISLRGISKILNAKFFHEICEESADKQFNKAFFSIKKSNTGACFEEEVIFESTSVRIFRLKLLVI